MHEMRITDRRINRVSLRWPERRTGFDRRRSYPVSSIFRSDDRRYAAVLALILLLGIMDWAFTSHALDALGAYEANPFMRAAFEAGSMYALGLKLVSLTAVIACMWWLRRHRSVIVVATVTAALHIPLIAYHVAGAAFFS